MPGDQQTSLFQLMVCADHSLIIIGYLYKSYVCTTGVDIDNDVEFKIGSNATVFCNSDAPTIHISWLSGNEIIVRENNTQSLGLNFTPVNDTVHGKVYTCIVERISETDMVERNFTLNTIGKALRC